MKAVWTGPAEQERWEIMDHIDADDPQAALNFDEEVSRMVARLEQFPRSGRIGRLEGTREAIIGKYVLVYELRKNCLLITHFVHGMRKFPPWLS